MFAGLVNISKNVKGSHAEGNFQLCCLFFIISSCTDLRRNSNSVAFGSGPLPAAERNLS